MTHFVNAMRTADTLIEVVRFIREARSASRRSADNARPAAVSLSAPAIADGRPSFPAPVRSVT